MYKQNLKIKILYVGRLTVFFWSRWDDVNDMRCFMCIKGLLLSREVPSRLLSTMRLDNIVHWENYGLRN